MMVILVPTLNRVDLLKQFINSYIFTKAVSPLLLLVDQEDLRIHQVGYDEVQALSPLITIVNTGTQITMGKKCRFAMRYIKDKFPEATAVGLLNDDHHCVTPEWDQIALKLLDGKNMISTNDGFWNFGINPVGLTAWSIPLLEECGLPIYPEDLQHLYIDNLWKAVGESSGCWKETMKINIEHRHVFRNLMLPDQTFHKSNNQQSYADDGKVFEKFMAENFKGIVNKILAFRSKEMEKAKHN